MNIRKLFSNAYRSLLPGFQPTVNGVVTFAQDLYGIPAYPTEFSPSDYKYLFKRNALAKRIVDMYPRECWRTLPVVTEGEDPKETAFEKEWAALSANPKIRLLQNFQKADILSGIGRFGILYLGLKDGIDPAKAASSDNNELLFLRAFDETNVTVVDFDQDRTSERYGMPLLYRIRLENNTTSTEVLAHWTRVIHIAENAIDTPVYGEPRLDPVIENVLNITLILKGSPHMFMRGGFPGYSFEAEPDVQITPEDEERMKEQIDAYVTSLTRFMTLQGVKANSLQVQLANPDPYIKIQINAVSASTGIPGRMLMGSEMGHLASTADKMTWEDRVHDRQETYLAPDIVLPVAERLQMINVLPATSDKIICTWKRVDSTSQKERAEVSKIQSEALATYASNPACSLIIPEAHFLKHIMGFAPSEITKILGDESELDLQSIEEEDETIKDKSAGSV